MRSSRFKIWLSVVSVAGVGILAAQVQPAGTAEVPSSATVDRYHNFDVSVLSLQEFLDKTDNPGSGLIRVAAGNESADDLLAESASESDSAPVAAEDPESGASADDLLAEESDDTKPAGADASESDGADNLLGETDTSSGDDSLLGDADSLLSDDSSSDADSLLSDDSSGDADSLLSGNSSDGDADSLLANDDDDDLLFSSGGDDANETAEDRKKEEKRKQELAAAANAEHEKLFTEAKYPSANTCATCHPKQYDEWSVSQHAYAQLSPVYMAFQTTVNMLTSSTNGDFCIRCHTPVGMNIGETPFGTNLDRSPAAREGITCVVCHRVNKNYGKISGRFALVEGDVFSPVFGPKGGDELKRVLSKPEEYRVSQSKDQPGRSIHTKVNQFFQLTEPSFCGSCHDVTLLNGFRLEEAFTEFKLSPAAKRGVSCQDCHMGKVQGVAAGYDFGPAATVGDTPTKDRRLSDHFFAGPDYSVIHPGIFPHNVEAAQLKTLREWLQFDHKAGWGTDKFEDSAAAKKTKFPKAWESIDDRYEAREILNVQFKRLALAKKKRLQVLKNGFKLSDIEVDRSDRRGLKFSVDVSNGTDGHGVPTGFDAERLVFLEVTVKDSRGETIYVSGDRDPNGDVRDAHSLYVHNGELERDKDLFSLQSKFIMRLNRGGEREQILAVPTSLDVLPFVRPETRATTIYGRPRAARKHKKNLEPGASRTATYKIPGKTLRRGEQYSISVKLISQMVPVNLIPAIQGAGFDYGMSPAQVAREIVAGSVVLWSRSTKVTIR